MFNNKNFYKYNKFFYLINILNKIENIIYCSFLIIIINKND